MTAKPSEKNPPRYKLHIVALSCLAIAQPLLDVIAKNAELLVARQATRLDLFILIAVLLIVVPGLLLVPGLVAQRLAVKLGQWVYLATITLLVTLLVLLALNDVMNNSGILAILLSLIGGLAFIVAYKQFEPLQMFTDFLAAAVVIIPVLFLVNSDINRAVKVFDVNEVQNIEVSTTTPIVMLILDELPLVSLLDETGNIDRGRYPNFAALADTSHWFRNARTLSGSTTVAVPSIVSGRISPDSLPVAAEFPNNLFTLFRESHKLYVTEQVTSLCPPMVCGKGDKQDPNESPERLDGFFVDLAIVYGYVLLPANLTNGLPPISQSWGNFADMSIVDSSTLEQAESVVTNELGTLRHEEYQRFINSIEHSETPGLYFFHALLPHVPWQYLPSGKLYDRRGTEVAGLDLSTEIWTSNEFQVENGYRRHLLQVGYADKMLGELISKLQSEDLFDDALITIVADHGANFYPGQARRDLINDDLELDILGIPLLVKMPKQSTAMVHDREVSTLDILPTITSEIGIKEIESITGNDLLDSTLASEKVDANPYIGYQSLISKISLFGSGSQTGLYGTGESAQLIGKSRNELSIIVDSDTSFQIDQESQLTDVLLDDLVLPTLLSGQLFSSQTEQQDLTLAAMLNDVIVATGRARVEEGRSKFSIMIPQNALHDGLNSFALFNATRSVGGAWALAPLLNTADFDFRYIGVREIEKSGNQQSSSNVIQVEDNRLRGSLDNVSLSGGFLEFSGWAADENVQVPAEYLLLEINSELMYLGIPNNTRNDVATALGSSAFAQSGFRFRQRAANFRDLTISEARVLAVSGQNASILNSNFDLVERIRELVD